jgi:hypothetical protein
MKHVVDSNFLQCEALRGYLSKSPENHVVMTDYAFMEAYKAVTLDMLYRSMEILSQYPKQVIVLKGTQTVRLLTGRPAQLQRRLIDVKGTREFARFCRHLAAARLGNRELEGRLLYRARAARHQMSRIDTDAEEFGAVLDAITNLFSDREQKIIRTGLPYTEVMGKKLVSHITLMAAMLCRRHLPEIKPPSAAEIRNMYLFRVALCMHVLAHRWISVGGVGGTKAEKIRNDLIDVSFAAYATYFDGIFSSDKKVNEIYGKAMWLINNACVVSMQ